jgi:hypothetical protein
MSPPVSTVIAALLLAGCSPAPGTSGDPPAAVVLRWDSTSVPDPLRPQNDPPDAIMIRWAAAASETIDPAYLAERHCLAWDRRAEQVSEQVDGATRRAEFVCKPLRQR